MNFLSFDSSVFIFFVFCISSNNLNSISCDICLSFKSRHLELLCKIIIQLSSTGILIGLWAKGPTCNFTEQLLFLHSWEWLLLIIYLISAIKKLQEEKLKKLGLRSFFLVSSNGWNVLYLASSKSRKNYSISLKSLWIQLQWKLVKAVSDFFLIIYRSLGI